MPLNAVAVEGTFARLRNIVKPNTLFSTLRRQIREHFHASSSSSTAGDDDDDAMDSSFSIEDIERAMNKGRKALRKKRKERAAVKEAFSDAKSLVMRSLQTKADAIPATGNDKEQDE